MFESMLDAKKENFWLALHVALGVLSALSKYFIIIWFVCILLGTLLQLLKNKNQDLVLVHIVCYTLGLEQIGRSLHCDPIIPYEICKYGILLTIIVALLYPYKNASGKTRKVRVGTFMLALSLPALFVLPEGYKNYEIVFNFFGPLDLALAITYFSKLEINYDDLKKIFKAIIFSIITFTTLIMLKQAQMEKVEYGLAANFATSGGTATNQVSAVLGFAFAIMALIYLTNQSLFKKKFIDQILTFTFLFRGLLTFSRGGIIAALLAIILVLIIPKSRDVAANKGISFKKINPAYYIIGVGFMIITFLLVNAVTGNFLLLRYQGYNEYSIRSGNRNLSNMTSSRSDIFESDIVIFENNPLFGVGVGQSSHARKRYGYHTDALAHSEVTRLLSEHGVFGLFILLIIILYPTYAILTEKNNYRKAFKTVFFGIGFFSMLHVAMRTGITPIAYGLACINVNPDLIKKVIKRKRKTAQINSPMRSLAAVNT